MQAISFRCKSKSEADKFYTVTVAWPGPTAACDCPGFDGMICSHVDATLIAGERAMVPDADRTAADAAMRSIVGLISIPKEWKGSWRYDYAWRGLPTRKIGDRKVPAVGHSGKPIVCFTGAMPRPRKELMREAEAAGWETVDRVHSSITVMVAADPNIESTKVLFAREHGIPIVTFEGWGTLTSDGEIVDPGMSRANDQP